MIINLLMYSEPTDRARLDSRASNNNSLGLIKIVCLHRAARVESFTYVVWHYL